ncbi:MurR/RpiR family transcriptional regulator [Kineosporia sp. J2-2]|uniref:MurR/RpiR family transcriptional regulator n=1 Tax=Kineosporia corallincola TaxID=2835133 RepID=A0ABS5TC26_9ACTN|nr:MurR/RpiR family transcriptional regulator [Kineosporia corallincola]MBT0768635.1 MurR/RpiR family transcriptional regulator [Kineosporia corallincola]
MSGLQGASAVGVTDLIRTALPDLSESLTRVARTVLEDPLAAAELSADQLASRSGASQASVTRFCKAIGLKSYQELLLRIAQESGRYSGPWSITELNNDISPDDPLEKVLETVLSADLRSLEQARERLDLQAVERAAQAIAKAGRVDLYGVGGSGAVANELEMRLFGIGVPARAWLEVHGAVTSASLLTTRDVAVGVSDSGATAETFEALQLARERGATTVAITRRSTSPLATLADIQLTVSGFDTRFRAGSFASRHVQLLVADVLYVRVAQLGFDRASAAIALTSHLAPSHSVARRRSTRTPG